MASILYLDVDDEITTAAARIRAAKEPKVALVLPPGSRLATSRMNFRLLAREAVEWNRVLSIVAPDAAAQAIAASAGLPVYASVGEYEATLPARAGLADAFAPAAPGPDTPPATPPPAAAQGESPLPPGPAPAVVEPPTAARPPAPRVVAEEPPPPPALTPPPEPRARSGAASMPVHAGTRARGRSGRAGLWVTLAILAVALAVLGIAGYLLLPSATVVVTPRPVKVGPVDFVVRADPNASSVDATAGVVPASVLTHDFTAGGEFPATGKRVVATKAKGIVRFNSLNTVGPVRVNSGTQVSTLGGVAFVTQATVVVPRATVSGSTITAGHASVAVVAAKAGPDGNVGSGEITRGPDSLVVQQVSVTNPDPTTGGKRDEFTRVQQSDIDAAVAALTKDVTDQFSAWSRTPDNLAAGTTAFPKTAALAAPIPTPDPSGLLNVEEPTFQLQLDASGSVVAVDTRLVEQVAAGRIKAQVPADRTFVAGSVALTVGEGQPVGEIVDFRVTASAFATPRLDAADLADRIKGKSVDEARRILAAYGDVSIATWPGFVSTIPTLDARLSLTVGAPTGTPAPEGSRSPGPSGSATP